MSQKIHLSPEDQGSNMKRALSDSEESTMSQVEKIQGDIFEEDDIEDLQRELSQSIPKDKALDFLNTLAASKGILYWNSHGEMLYHQRRIPVTSMVDLIDYAMLPYSIDVKAPRGIVTFTKGLSEVGIDKKLIKNKRLLADLVARQPESEEESDDSSSERSDSSESEGSDSNEDDNSGDESSSADDKERECHVCEDFKPFYSIPVLQCPVCKWREAYYSRDNQIVECDVCLSNFLVDGNTTKVKFVRCKDCDTVYQDKNNQLEMMEYENDVE